MIRVLHVNASMNLGGIETFIMNLYRNINRDKVQFDFLLHTNKKCYYEDEIKNLGGKIYYIPSRRKGIIKNKRELEKFFSSHNEYKIVHQHVSSLSYIEPINIAKKNNIPIRIIHGHNVKQAGSYMHKYIHKINQNQIEKSATDYFACSELAAKWMYSKTQIEEKKYKVINNCIEIDKFEFSDLIRSKVRSEFNLKDKFVIGHIGRFHKQKNHEFLIDIFGHIHDKNKDAILMLVGSGELESQIRDKVNAMGLNNNVIFTGIRSDVCNLLQAMDIFVFPSLYEGLGIVLVEAQASGLKCFTSKDVVPQDVNVANLVEFIDLKCSASFWADKILSERTYNRNSTREKILANGYDISQLAKELEIWYQMKLG